MSQRLPDVERHPGLTRPWLASTERLEALPRLGWTQAPTPVVAMPALAADLGLDWLGTKRDDQTEPLWGGAKTRKLDYLLAAEPWRSAPAWASVGAIGSGQLLALTAAARKLDRRVAAFLFWEPLSAGVLDNLACVASNAEAIYFHPSRVTLALRRPGLLLGSRYQGMAVVPPGATLPRAMVGLVRAGVEIAMQVRAGVLPAPQRVYVTLGSGGTAVGLALGLAWGGLQTTVHAVAAVERLLATRGRLRSLARGLRQHLVAAGFGDLAEVPPAPIVIDWSQVGPGYGHVSGSSLDAVSVLRDHGIDLEPIYTGKAMAALLRDAELARSQKTPLGSVLFWNTVRRAGPLPRRDDWRERLPTELQQRLVEAEQTVSASSVSRRRWLTLTGLAAVGGLAWWRLGRYPTLTAWPQQALSEREAQILMMAAEAVLAPMTTDTAAWARLIDGYVAELPPRMRRDLHLAVLALEQAPLLSGRWRRFSEAPLGERQAVLRELESSGGNGTEILRAVRDLAHLGGYAQPAAWPAIGYTGPWVAAEPRPRRAAWAALVAPAGRRPKAAR